MSWHRIVSCAALALCGIARAETYLPFSSVSLADSSYATGQVLVREDRSFGFPVRGNPDEGVEWTSVSGMVRSTVVRALDGTIDFYWQVTTFRNTVFRFSVLEFTDPAYTLSAGWLSDGPGITAPHSAYPVLYPLAPNVSRDVRFGFDEEFESSKIFFLDTDARGYTRTARFLVGPQVYNSFEANGPTFAPGLIPEPQTWALLVAGLVAVAARARGRAGRSS